MSDSDGNEASSINVVNHILCEKSLDWGLTTRMMQQFYQRILVISYFSVLGSMTVLSDEASILCKTMTLMVLLEGKRSVILHNFYLGKGKKHKINKTNLDQIQK